MERTEWRFGVNAARKSAQNGKMLAALTRRMHRMAIWRQRGNNAFPSQQRLSVATGRRGITAAPPEAPSAVPGSTTVPPEAPSAGMAKKVIFLPHYRLKQKNFAENRLKHRFLLADC
ncbi:MAG: hypothetical protein IKI85_01990 [Bacteroidales bacterium]|nr:hypothetical protein [Bacteroidales bacterium]